MASAICALSALVLIRIFSGNRTFSLWNYAAVIPLGLSPYFLGCMVFRYDSPYMALSVLASLVPFLFYRRKSLKAYGIVSFCGQLVMCMTYQASSGIYPMMVVILCFLMWIRGEESKRIFRFFWVSLFVYVEALLIFELLLALFVTETRENVDAAFPELKELFPTIFENYEKYFKTFWNDMKLFWKICIGMILLCFLGTSVWRARRNKFAALGLSLLTLVLSILLMFGVYPLMAKPLYVARTMYGIGVLIAILSVVVVQSCPNRFLSPFTLGKLAITALSWCFFVFSFTFGNALFVQQEYTDMRMQEIIDDLTDLEVMKTGGTVELKVVGSIGYAPVVRNMPSDSKMLKRLLRVQLDDSQTAWGDYLLLNYYGLPVTRASETFGLEELYLESNTTYHAIYTNDTQVLVYLKDLP